METSLLDRSREGNQTCYNGALTHRSSLVGSLRHSSSDYRCSNQTLVTIVGTVVRFEL